VRCIITINTFILMIYSIRNHSSPIPSQTNNYNNIKLIIEIINIDTYILTISFTISPDEECK